MREQFAQDAAKTQAELAERLGIDKSGVSRILRGQRMVKAHEVAAIAEYFGEMPPIGLQEDAASYVAGAAALAPVFRMTADARGGWRLYKNEPPIDRLPPPARIAMASLVFGAYAPDDLASPRFKPGEVIWADPGRPPRPGDDVLLLETRQRGPQRAEIGELIAQSKSDIRFSRHRDGHLRTLTVRVWSPIHLPGRL